MKVVVFSILLGVLVVPSAYAFVPSAELFAYGPANGDYELPIDDDNFANVTLELASAFKFFKSSYSNIFVNNDGAISFYEGKH